METNAVKEGADDESEGVLLSLSSRFLSFVLSSYEEKKEKSRG